MAGLNEFKLQNDGDSDRNIQDNSVTGDERDTQVFFRNITDRLLKEISKSEVVLGCVAWLTNKDILRALSKKSHVSIIVQKEDFLRPDIGATTNWKSDLRALYDGLKCGIERHMFGNLLGQASFASDPQLKSVRCVGNYNREKSPAFPRMHNKFLVFANTNQKHVFGGSDDFVIPRSVWTGSFNLTYNASQSLENALLIKDPEIVHAYYHEFGQIAAMSEPLDWTSDWVEPEWRLGT
jgi:hypothetical protein